MPRKKSTSPALDTPEKNVTQGRWWCAADAPWFGFVNVALNEGDKSAFHDWDQEHYLEVPQLLEDVIAAGMKYGVAWDAENECFVVTFTGNLVEGSNTRACVTTRAGTWAEANALAVWKHYELLAENYGDLMATGRKRNWG